MKPREREVSLGDYLNVVFKRKQVIILSVAVVTLSSLFFGSSQDLIYKASSYIGVEASDRDSNLARSINRFVESRIFSEEMVSFMKFEKAKGLKAGGELSEDFIFDIDADVLQNSLSIEEEGPNILKISALAGSSKKSKYIADVAAKVVAEQSRRGLLRSSYASLKYVERQIEILKQRIDEIKKELSRYTPVITAEEVLLPEEEQELEKLQQDYINSKLKRQMAEAQLKVLEEKLARRKTREVFFSSVPQSDQLVKLNQELAGFKSKLSELLIQFTEEHPRVIEVQAQIERTRGQIDREVVKPLEDLKVQIAAAKDKEETLKEIMEVRFPVRPEVSGGRESAALKTFQLKRELKIHEKTYDRLLEEKEKINVDFLLDATKVKILRLAAEPKRAEKPKSLPPVVIAVSMGLILGLTLAFIQENLDTSLKTINDIEYYLNQPVIGVIPVIRSEKKKVIDSRMQQIKGKLFPQK